jgi:hypothetical protein
MTLAPRFFAIWMPMDPRLPETHHQVLRHRRVAREHAGIGEADALRHDASRRRRHLGHLRVAAPAVDAEHLAIAEALEHRDVVARLAVGDALTHRDDDAGRVDAAHVRELDVALRLLARTHRDVEHAVDRARMHTKRDLARARHRIGQILVVHDFGRAELAVDHRFHRSFASS